MLDSLGMAMNTTQELLDERYRALSDRPDGPAPSKKVAVISTPRTGSSLFCERLTQTQVCGFAAEWFNPVYIKSYCRVFDITDFDFDAYRNFVIRKTTTPNGVFSVNFHIRQYMHWQKKGFDILGLEFDRVYYIHRKDRLAQALSLLKARTTKQWSSDTKAVKEFSVPESLNSAIIAILGEIALWDEYYEETLSHYAHRDFTYEAFQNDPSLTAEILADCAIEYTAPAKPEAQMKRQSNTADHERLERLRLYLGGGL